MVVPSPDPWSSCHQTHGRPVIRPMIIPLSNPSSSRCQTHRRPVVKPMVPSSDPSSSCRRNTQYTSGLSHSSLRILAKWDCRVCVCVVLCPCTSVMIPTPVIEVSLPPTLHPKSRQLSRDAVRPGQFLKWSVACITKNTSKMILYSMRVCGVMSLYFCDDSYSCD